MDASPSGSSPAPDPVAQAPARRPRGRPRSSDAEQRILTAALEEYAERGWAGFTMDAVARRAGVGKSTVYLRWASKDALLIDSVKSRSVELADIDRGSLRADIEAVAASLYRYYLDPIGWATLRLAVDAVSDSMPVNGFMDEIAGMHWSGARAIVRRAQDRGEVGPDLPVDPLVQCLYGAVTVHVLGLGPAERNLPDERIDAFAAALADFVIRAATS